MKKTYLAILLSVTSFWCAEARKVEVHVMDFWNRPLSEVTICTSNTQSLLGLTDEQGCAQIEVPEGSEIILTLFNRQSRIVRVNTSRIEVRLSDKDRLFDIGYDERIRKSESTASLSQAVSEDIQASGNTTVMNNLYGLIPGLGVYQGSNLPWDNSPSLYVRGQGSFGGNQVLVLVDGIERDMAQISPKEVESITVLKDAASLALYGNRGADGVVVITTKRGGDHGLRSQIDYNFGVQTPFRIPHMADGYTYASAVNEALSNDGLSPRYTMHDMRLIAGHMHPQLFPDIDWQALILRKVAFTHDVNLTFDGKGQRIRYFVYANYNSNRGFLNNTEMNDGYSTQIGMDALKVRSNIEARLTKSTVARINLMGRLMQYQHPSAGTNLSGMYDTPAAAFYPLAPQSEGGGWVRSRLCKNPLADLTSRGYNTVLQRTLFADLTIDQNLEMITPGLSAQVRVAYDNSAEITDMRTCDFAYMEVSSANDEIGNVKELLYTPYGNNRNMEFNSKLSTSINRTSVWAKILYDRKFGAHGISARLIFNENRSDYRGANNSYMYRDGIVSGGYNYDSRYLFNAVLTYAGASQMPAGDKYRVYPAFAVAWIASNESFLHDNRIVDLLKLRASFGVTGMSARLSYDMDKQFNGGGNSYIFVGSTSQYGTAQGALPSTGIEPEREYRSNIGIELSLFKALTLDADFFYNKRRNIRISSEGTLSGVLGIGTPDVFTGEVRNYGWEVALGWRKQIGDFSYGLHGQISYAKNKIIRKEEGYKPHWYMYASGNTIDRFYGLMADGLYQSNDFNVDGTLRPGLPVSTYRSNVQPGDVKYVDLNGDGRIDANDCAYQLYAALPQIYYGFNIELEWRGFGLNAYFQGMGRSTVTTTLASIYQPLYGNERNISEHYMENRWSPYNTSGHYPRLTTQSNANNFAPSSLWTECGDFLKLRTLSLSYKLPARLASKIRMRECCLYLKGMNLFSADRIDILDPEYINTGYPSARSYQIGFNLIF